MIKALLFGLAAGSAALFFASPAAAQSTGFQGFLQRAGSVVSQSASAVLGKKGPASPAGTTTTTGATFRPISPADGGQFPGLFNHWKQGDASPRAALYFTKWGSSLPCWTARATVWRSPTSHHDETFQVCNAPLVIKDDMGGTQTLGATGGFDPSQTSFKIDSAQNIQGISHADSSNERDTGPNPPHNLFALNWGSHRALLPQYYEIVLRAMYACGYEDPTSKGINTMAGKSLWVVGFDQAGNADAGAAP
jgi:hypothetical protein